MGGHSRSIGRQIDDLARLTGAPAPLVEEIRAIFARGGIALEDDVLPYLEVLEETFSSAALLERDGASGREAAARRQESSRRFADACQELYGQLRSMEDYLNSLRRLAAATAAGRRSGACTAFRRSPRSDRPFILIPAPSEPE